MQIKAKFAQMAIKSGGKVVMTFEMESYDTEALSDLATIAGSQVLLDVLDQQAKIELEWQEVLDDDGTLAVYGERA